MNGHDKDVEMMSC